MPLLGRLAGLKACANGELVRLGAPLALAVLLASPIAAGQDTSPQRIISLVPAVTEMLFAIGAGPRVVGVGSFDRHPPEVERLPRVGALLDPNVERILSLRPDLVVVYGTQTDLRQQLDRAGIASFSYVHAGLPDVAQTIRQLGVRTGAAREGERVANALERDLTAVRTRVRGWPRPRTLLVFGRDPGGLQRIHASGGKGFLHDMLELAGGQNVLASLQRESAQVSVETILGLAPQAIVELRYGGHSGPGPERLARDRDDWRIVPSVPAVRAGRVHILVGDEFVVPGPRVTLATEKLARALHPEAFAAR